MSACADWDREGLDALDEMLDGMLAPEIRATFARMLDTDPKTWPAYLDEHSPGDRHEIDALCAGLATCAPERALSMCLAWAEEWNADQRREFADLVGVLDDACDELREVHDPRDENERCDSWRQQ